MVEIEKHDDYCTVQVNQPLTKSYASDLYFSIHENIDRGVKRFLVNCGSITSADSAGLEVMEKLNRELRDMKGLFVLFNLTPLVLKILNLTRLDKRIQITENRLEAELLLKES